MSAYKALFIAAGSGAAVPLVILMGGKLLPEGAGFSGALMGYIFFILSLMVWPSRYFLFVAPDDWGGYLPFLTIAIAVNVLIYSAFGLLIWLAIKKYRPLVYPVAIVILAYWVLLFKL
ncbi:MAG TPA: hypothetical protein VK522_15990 [Pseudolabrys sp.]|nr:hypothetical protein [Pseudolabrys sp.]